MEKPILFNTEMVKAILEGRKTQTRRLIKKKYDNADIEFFTNKYGTRLVYMQNDAASNHLRACEEIKKPYNIGDILYVRETWAFAHALNKCRPSKMAKESIRHQIKENLVWYRADGDQEIPKGLTLGERLGERGKWRPSIHMPKQLARIFLRVTNVRAERLQEISDEDILKEGIIVDPNPSGYLRNDYRFNFSQLWGSVYNNWNENPWVWVIEFERIKN